MHSERQKQRISRRQFLDLSAMTAAGALLAGCAPSPSPTAPATTSEGETAVPPTSGAVPEGDVTTYKEAPMLSDMVQAGQLPPVDERLPDEPLVWAQPDVLAFEKVEGTYGGTLHTAAIQEPQGMATIGLVRPSSDWQVFYPDIAESWQWSEDATTITFDLRKGHKWSDGEPFTARDLDFYWHDVLNCHYLAAPMGVHGLDPSKDNLVAVDDYTVRLEFAEAKPVFFLSSTGFRAGESTFWERCARHFWEQFHPDYNKDPDYADPKAQFQELVADRVRSYSNASQVPDVPVLCAFRTVEYQEGQLQRLERNPYFHVVDRWGKQLPYLDYEESFLLGGADKEVAKLKMIAGEVDWDRRYLGVGDIPMLREHEEEANLDPILVTMTCNGLQNIRFMPGNSDPNMQALIHNADFRRAMSIAIDRAVLNETVFLGMGKVGQGFSEPGVYDPEIDSRWAEYDPDKANAMLDEIGLDRRDPEGFRTFPNGDKLTWIHYYWPGWLIGTDETAELAVECWKAVGIRAVAKGEPWGTYTSKARAGDPEVCSIAHVDHGGIPVRDWKYGSSVRLWAFRHFEWWRDTDTSEAQRAGLKPEGEILELLQLEDEAFSTLDEDRRQDIWARRREILADSCWFIGMVQCVPHVVLARKNLGGVWGRTSDEAEFWLGSGDEEYWPRSWFWAS